MRLSPNQARVLVDAFLADLDTSGQSSTTDAVTYLAVAATTDVLDTAVTLCGIHGLRAYDAVQVASAVRARGVDATVSELVTYDVTLHRQLLRRGSSSTRSADGELGAWSAQC